MHKFMFLKAIKITMPRTNAKTTLKIYFLNGINSVAQIEIKSTANTAHNVTKYGGEKKRAKFEINGKD